MTAITVINPFEVPDNRHDEALTLWDRANSIFQRHEGFVSARLYAAVDPATRYAYVTVAKWQSPDAFIAALTSADVQALERDLAEFPHAPGAYTVIRDTDGGLRGG